MADLAVLTQRNAARWKAAKLTRGPEFAPVAKRLIAAKARYQGVADRTGVPWFVIAVIHEREASQRWDKNIAQGDPWNGVSIHVPKGRGPFSSWEQAAIDALTQCAPYAGRWKDWSTGGTLTLLEQYNGLGYAYRGLPSPYIWSGTDQYQSGKYVADGVFDPSAVDRQLGCAGLLMAMRALDPGIRFADETVPPPDIEPVPPKAPKTALKPKHAASVATVLASIIAAMQAHKIETAIGVVIVGVLIALAIHFLLRQKG
jgi:lysozyme family protein